MDLRIGDSYRQFAVILIAETKILFEKLSIFSINEEELVLTLKILLAIWHSKSDSNLLMQTSVGPCNVG